MNPRELKSQIEAGVRALGGAPCTICKSGIPFSEFPHVHGSDFGKCLREAQYDKVVNPEPFHSMETSMRFRDGHVHEAATVDLLRAAGLKVDHRLDAPDGVQNDEFVTIFVKEKGGTFSYKTVVPTPGISPKALMAWAEAHRAEMSSYADQPSLVVIGHTDGVIEDKFLLEHKASWSPRSLSKMRSGTLKVKWINQAKCYITCLSLEKGFIVVKDRGKSEILLPFEVDRDDNFVFSRVDAFIRMIEDTRNQAWSPCTPLDLAEKRWCAACKALGD